MGKKEHVRARFIAKNTVLWQISCVHVLLHGTAPYLLFQVRSKIKLKKEGFDSACMQTLDTKLQRH